MLANISGLQRPEEEITRLLSVIGQPARIQILHVIASQEACVCHLEAVLGLRQASISQHLMILRKAGVVSTTRDGRHIYYRLAIPGLIDLLRQAAQFTGANPEGLLALSARPVAGCPCPQCNPDLDQEMD